MSVIDMITVISFALSCFLAGYNFGKDIHRNDDKKQK